MPKYPHAPAAFINAVAEEGTKEDAVKYLQEQWNETCALRAALKQISEWNGHPNSIPIFASRVLGQS